MGGDNYRNKYSRQCDKCLEVGAEKLELEHIVGLGIECMSLPWNWHRPGVKDIGSSKVINCLWV